jgi:hypothetical protein
LQLLHSGGAVISLLVYEPLADPHEPRTAQFVDCEIFEIVLAGKVQGLFHEIACYDGAQVVGAQADMVTAEQFWRSASRITQNARSQSRQFIAVEEAVLVLQLSRAPQKPGPTCEFDLRDGALVHQSSEDKQASQHVVALAVLGALEHRPALVAIEAIALNQARTSTRDIDVWWEAVRQTLALDTMRGMELLGQLAGALADPLSLPAANLLKQLQASHRAIEPPMKERV